MPVFPLFPRDFITTMAATQSLNAGFFPQRQRRGDGPINARMQDDFLQVNEL
jgi:hypothetical protein